MIKKFNQFLKEELNNKYENSVISAAEFLILLDERWIKMSNSEIDEIEKYINSKYSQEYEIKIDTRSKNVNASSIIVSMKNNKMRTALKFNLKYAAFSVCKLTDEWFVVNLATYRHPNIHYKCDEMRGLLNQIDEIVNEISH
jgi:hypothetical protein